MDYIWLFDNPSSGRFILACREEDIRSDIDPGTKVYRLGIAAHDIPPGRMLVTVDRVSSLFYANAKAFIPKPE